MNPKRYRIVDGVLRFENDIDVFEDYLYVPEGVFSLDFNNVQHLKKPLDLSRLPHLKEIDLKNLVTIDRLYLPPNVSIKENLYWAHQIVAPNAEINSVRMKHVGVYDRRTLIYLSGTIKGYLDLRRQQRDRLISEGFAVYSPGNHITFGDPVADNNPKLVADIDIQAMERAEIIFFDLNNLSPGTCAELGYAIGAGWHITKELYYMYTDTPNFFINGLLRYMNRVSSLEEFIQRTYEI